MHTQSFWAPVAGPLVSAKFTEIDADGVDPELSVGTPARTSRSPATLSVHSSLPDLGQMLPRSQQRIERSITPSRTECNGSPDSELFIVGGVGQIMIRSSVGIYVIYVDVDFDTRTACSFNS